MEVVLKVLELYVNTNLSQTNFLFRGKILGYTANNLMIVNTNMYVQLFNEFLLRGAVCVHRSRHCLC